MTEPARKRAVYEDLFDIPRNMTGEIVNGELVVTPRPSRKHANTASMLTAEIIPPYRSGRGGPGGWIILDEPEVSFGEDILVPDLAGWKKERFPGVKLKMNIEEVNLFHKSNRRGRAIGAAGVVRLKDLCKGEWLPRGRSARSKYPGIERVRELRMSSGRR
jgi:hypothetical protein